MLSKNLNLRLTTTVRQAGIAANIAKLATLLKPKETTVRDILVQAAKAGDEEAIELLASGLSQEKIIE